MWWKPVLQFSSRFTFIEIFLGFQGVASFTSGEVLTSDNNGHSKDTFPTSISLLQCTGREEKVSECSFLSSVDLGGVFGSTVQVQDVAFISCTGTVYSICHKV